MQILPIYLLRKVTCRQPVESLQLERFEMLLRTLRALNAKLQKSAIVAIMELSDMGPIQLGQIDLQLRSG
ncbi:hypothetical protein RM61_21495 [Xanthomonas phaseoli pv. phaseoli]|nr:hypothetical protein RM61_21495 [Xanthomonas phaseoli pv. phaseoli]